MRPINNVVDASNYVMLELGQPTHPYDLDRLGGRAACGCGGPCRGRRWSPSTGWRAPSGDRASGSATPARTASSATPTTRRSASAGSWAAQLSEISETTTRVLLEAAYFTPMAMARTSKRLGLRTEASARFERGCDPEGIDRAARRFCEVLAVTAGPARAAGARRHPGGGARARSASGCRPARVNAMLGSALDDDAVAG